MRLKHEGILQSNPFMEPSSAEDTAAGQALKSPEVQAKGSGLGVEGASKLRPACCLACRNTAPIHCHSAKSNATTKASLSFFEFRAPARPCELLLLASKRFDAKVLLASEIMGSSHILRCWPWLLPTSAVFKNDGKDKE